MVRPCSCLCQNVGWQEVPLAGEIAALARQDAGCERLMSVPGIGPIISSAGVAAAGTGEAFSKGRDFAAWLGLVPKQVSTGDRTILGKISKRGNSGGRRGRGLYLCRQRNFRGKTCWRATSFEQVGGLSAGPFSGFGGARRMRCLRALRWPCQFDRFHWSELLCRPCWLARSQLREQDSVAAVVQDHAIFKKPDVPTGVAIDRLAGDVGDRLPRVLINVHAIVSVSIRTAMAIIEIKPHSSPLPRVPDYGGSNSTLSSATSGQQRYSAPHAASIDADLCATTLGASRWL